MKGPPILTRVTRAWIPLVLVVVLAIGGFTVWRVRGIFGSHELPTYAGSMSEDSNKSDPRRVRYEVFGQPGAVADINYIDASGDPNQVNGVTLPWSVEVESYSPAMVGNVVAQGDGDFIGCRIVSDGEVRDERTAYEVSAYIYCFTKSA
ncbi:putative membrane protein, MmpS [Mycolicibacterium cyprinidarum]|uniref:Membrane protein, MmpS n=1 Tax=Mycolicibacterium cyprinidarum TaxID=2860311 RepID=A0ABQ4VAR6_9MYCO|nr:putative membrane protein, MmpS [Mycolicibacterium sp. NGTWS0302]GJF13705.1 putative membrane protein, MmpS [Mycolicibacterium sp. NGTWS1803]GJF15497.1 putative membrane protein, MmpS [Mycolicibacterium sp. NGTWSNA01]